MTAARDALKNVEDKRSVWWDMLDALDADGDDLLSPHRASPPGIGRAEVMQRVGAKSPRATTIREEMVVAVEMMPWHECDEADGIALPPSPFAEAIPLAYVVRTVGAVYVMPLYWTGEDPEFPLDETFLHPWMNDFLSRRSNR